MKANEESLKFLDGDQTQFVVPFFQRPYVWDEENWDRLLESLESNNSSHYLGSIIIKENQKNDKGFYYYEVIDGQQRITTLSILMKALITNINSSTVKNALSAKLYCRYDSTKKYEYKTKKGKKNYVVKLVLGFHDKEIYDELIENPTCAINNYSDSQIVKCYRYFLTKTKNKKIAKQIYSLLINTTIKFVVKIELEEKDNAQAIFDVSNGTGVSLTCADIIKNDLFLHITEKNRIAVYQNSWKKTLDDDDNYKFWSEVYNTRTNIENLLFSIAQIEKNGSSYIYDANNDTFEELSNKYRKFFDKQTQKGLQLFVYKIVKYSKIYMNYFVVDKTNQYSEDDTIPRFMLSYSRLNACTVLFPYLFKLFEPNCDDDGIIISSKEQYINNKLAELERLLVRSAIVSNAFYIDKDEKPSPKNFNKTITKVIRSMNVNDLFTSKQLKSINDNKRIKEGLIRIDSRDNNTASILLFLLNLKMVKKLGNKTNTTSYTYNYELEHIMPQEFHKFWGLPTIDINGKKIKGKQKEEYRSNYVHQIGNMTIITPKANRSIKNYDIKTKMIGDNNQKAKTGIKKGYQGYVLFASEPISSRFKADIIKSKYQWNEKMISDRTKRITTEILNIWP